MSIWKRFHDTPPSNRNQLSLPPRYLSCTASTSVVVNALCQLVSFVRDCKAWDKYITGSTPIDMTRTRVRDSSSTLSSRSFGYTEILRS